MPRSRTNALVSTHGRLVLDAGGRVVTDGAGTVARLVLVAVLARSDGPAALGLLAIATALASVAQLAGVAGSADWVAANVARGRVGASTMAGLRVITRTGPATALLLAVGGVVVGGDGAVVGIGAALLLVTAAPSLVLRGGLIGHGYLRLAAIGGAVDGLVATVVGIVTLRAGWGTGGAIAALVAGEIANVAVTLLVFARRKIALRAPAGEVSWRVVLREGIVLSPIKPLTAMYQRADVTVLAAVAGTAAVGYYSAATGITLTIPVLAVALSEATFPRLAAALDPERVGRAFARQLVVVAVPCAALVVVAGPAVLRLVYGETYDAAATTLCLLALALPATFANIGLGNAWIAGGRGGLRATGLALGLVVNLVVVGLAGAAYGAAGAAAATAIAELVQLAFYLLAPSFLAGPVARTRATNGPWERPASALMVGSNGG